MVFPTPPPSQHAAFTPIHGRNAHLFQPPKSPASVAATPSHATSSTDYFSNGASRKRSRPASSYHERAQGDRWNTIPAWAQNAPTPNDDDVFSSGQNSLLVNDQYKLSGGYDTPGLAANTELDRLVEQDAQARRYTRDRDATFGNSGSCLSGPLARERNGLARLPDIQTGEPPVSWTRFAFSLVGKAFNFGTNVFKGFYAGGGTGYDFNNEKQWYDGASPQIADYARGPPTPVPGQWQSDDFFGDFEQDNPMSPPSSGLRPPNKRRQTDKDAWVMVGTPDNTGPSPKRKVSGGQVIQSNKTSTPRPSASRASSRRSFLPTATRRQTSHVTQLGSPATFTAGHDRRASVANVRSPGSRPSSSAAPRNSLGPGFGAEYVSPDAERYRKRQAKQDRVADKTIGNMSRQLEELIRQGQAALGTKFSVEGDADEEMDDGFGSGKCRTTLAATQPRGYGHPPARNDCNIQASIYTASTAHTTHHSQHRTGHPSSSTILENHLNTTVIMAQTETSINIPQLLAVALVGFFAIRWYMNKPLPIDGGNSSGSSSSASRNRAVDPAQISQVSAMFPQLDRRSIAWDLHRNGGNVAATSERILTGRGLDNPPPSYQPPLPAQPAAARSSAAPATAAGQQDLITRYGLQGRINDKGKEAVRSEEQKRTSAWTSDKAARAEGLKKRREEMVLEARRKMLEKDAGRA
ncbi:hypothetical protein Q7P37_011152 [Cladosporium fusiforme]